MTNPPAVQPRFDWYAATIPDGAQAVLQGVSDGMRADVREARKGIHGYRQQFEIVRSGSVCARVLAGGQNGYPNAFASGQESEEFARIVRENWPEHRVSRMDSALDFEGAGDWERLTTIALGLADERGLKVGYAGDWHRGIEGRTIYIGSRKSAVFVRIYEKGKQLPEEGRPDWVRVEVVVRPDGDSRAEAAHASATAAWGYAAWTVDFAAHLLAAPLSRVAISVRKPSDDDRAMKAVVEQYWRVFERQAAAHGGWEGLGREIGRRFDDLGRGWRRK